MIVVDSSAIVAILEAEDDAVRFAQALAAAERVHISAVNAHERGVVLRVRRGLAAVERFWTFLTVENDFQVVPFDERQARLAVIAFSRFGKGIDPDARLNLADCAAYALATSLGLPLLFKGDDFTHTDVRVFS